VTDLWHAIDPAVRLDPNDYIDWEAIDRETQQHYGDVATFWVQATPGVNYYRAVLPARHLPGRVVSFNETDVNADGRFRRQVGSSVWMFPGNDLRAVLMAEQHLQGIPVWVEVDDNYTVAPPLLETSVWARNRKESRSTGQHDYETHVKIVRSKAVDGVICSTPKLAEVYSRLHPNVRVCRNSVDPADWPDGEPPHSPDGVLRVGWAGSASHAYDIRDIHRALGWASGQPDVEVVVFGELDMPIPHRNIPWTDSLEVYRENVSQIDVMLCPIRPSAWSDCKSDVKALEAAMGGACSIVSRTEPFRPWWGEGRPCYVADTPKDFLKLVKHVVRSRDEVRETARLAREYVLGERVIAREIDQWRAVLAT
jgi:hypothetical protein